MNLIIDLCSLGILSFMALMIVPSWPKPRAAGTWTFEKKIRNDQFLPECWLPNDPFFLAKWHIQKIVLWIRCH